MLSSAGAEDTHFLREQWWYYARNTADLGLFKIISELLLVLTQGVLRRNLYGRY